MKRWRPLAVLALALWCLGGCATVGLKEQPVTLGPGHTATDLLAQYGQPLQVLSGPQGGKIYFYQRHQISHMAIMGTGAWGKPEDTYYWLDPQGVIYKVSYYPYGKRKFIFPTEEAPTVTAAPAAPSVAAPAAPAPPPAPPVPPAAAAPAPPAGAPRAAPPPPAPTAAPAPTPAPVPTPSAPGQGLAASARLELRMTKAEVERLLGAPDHTEGFMAGNTAVVIWFYIMEDRRGQRVVAPLVFKEGRLAGWGEAYYQKVLKEAQAR